MRIEGANYGKIQNDRKQLLNVFSIIRAISVLEENEQPEKSYDDAVSMLNFCMLILLEGVQDEETELLLKGYYDEYVERNIPRVDDFRSYVVGDAYRILYNIEKVMK